MRKVSAAGIGGAGFRGILRYMQAPQRSRLWCAEAGLPDRPSHAGATTEYFRHARLCRGRCRRFADGARRHRGGAAALCLCGHRSADPGKLTAVPESVGRGHSPPHVHFSRSGRPRSVSAARTHHSGLPGLSAPAASGRRRHGKSGETGSAAVLFRAGLHLRIGQREPLPAVLPGRGRVHRRPSAGSGRRRNSCGGLGCAGRHGPDRDFGRNRRRRNPQRLHRPTADQRAIEDAYSPHHIAEPKRSAHRPGPLPQRRTNSANSRRCLPQWSPARPNC